ncbi:MAG: tetratricopeptide repeat protein [Desulfobacca sp.]|uniref:tetratricopeptide repeat protein n=1 Tax=Desulfobacca sp. TaxID=2067990 RepID=UPI00404B4B17
MPLEAASAPVARIINLFGQVSIRAGGSEVWQPGQVNQELSAGDVIQTGPASGAAILCVDESQIKLNENTSLELRQVAASRRLQLGEVIPAAVVQTVESLYKVNQGEIWLRNKNDKFRFELETPAVTASIRGTEFNLRVDRDGVSILTMLEGLVNFANRYGGVTLAAGEEGLARPGQAPTKRVVVNPADAVQWALYYPGIFSPREIPVEMGSLPGAAPALQAAAVEYNHGRLAAARPLVAEVLSRQPQNAAALTLMGWILFQEQELAAAREHWQRISPPNDGSVVGLALAHYRLGDQATALQLMQTALRERPQSPLLLTMAGYFYLVAGNPQEAQRLLETAQARAPSLVLPQSLLVQIYLVQNRKDTARSLAEQVVAAAPHSPQAWLSLGLVKIAFFDLPAALQHFKRAVELDANFVEAYIYLAKIWLGSDYLDRAQWAVTRARQLAPHNGEVLSMAGFVRLAFRDFAGARRLFNRAVALSPGLGEPHLGLGLVAFRYRQMSQGLAEILTATLLEPRLSLYQSELGKALYQVRAFDKALEVYDYAKTLDPRDPTPYLYKGIALTDLNRPGEAIQEINRSIALNDNRAVFRTRLALNRDLAVRNFNLAKSFLQLQLGDWAYRKAVTSVQKDPTNASAYLFLSSAFGASRNRLGSGISALLLYRLLSPANENTYSQGLIGQSTIDYTPMYEMPYFRVLTQGSIGCWPNRNAVTENFIEAYGGRPGLAFDAGGFYNENQGFRSKNGGGRNYSVINSVKYEPTVKDSILAGFTYYDAEAGDTSSLTDAGYQPVAYFRQYYHGKTYELGYVRRFNPNATFLSYFTYKNENSNSRNYEHYQHELFPNIFPGVLFDEDVYTSRRIPREFWNIQVQQQLVWGDHTFMAGFDYFSGHLKYRLETADYWSVFGTPLPFLDQITREDNRPPERSYTFYLLDYWQVHPKILVEAGVFKDYAKNSRYGFARPVSNSLWNFRLGLNYFATAEHTFRLLVQRNLNTHYFTTPSLVPPQVAGFPWLINIDEGGMTREIGVAWEAQWTPRTFTVLQFNANRIDNPVFEPYFGVGGEILEQRVYWGWKRYLAHLSVNQILSPSWGLALGVILKKVDPSFVAADPARRDFSEVDAGFTFSYLHPRGWQGFIRNYLIYQDLMGRGDYSFWLADLGVGQALPNKRGLVSLEINNIFDRRFYYAREPVALEGFFPSRRILFKLALFF